MTSDHGASLRDRAGGLRPEPASQSQPEALIPCAVVASTICRVLNVPSEHRSKLQARINNFRRLGFPADLPPPGKGKAALYSPKQAFEMLLACEMNRFAKPIYTMAVIDARRDKLFDCAMRGQPILFRPEAALAVDGLSKSPLRKCSGHTFWNVGKLWADFVAALPASAKQL